MTRGPRTNPGADSKGEGGSHSRAGGLDGPPRPPLDSGSAPDVGVGVGYPGLALCGVEGCEVVLALRWHPGTICAYHWKRGEV